MLVGLLAGCANNDPGTETPSGGGESTPPATESSEPAGDTTDWANFTIDPAQIPQEKLDTTLYLAVSIRGLENPYIATINEGMKLFAEYLDSIGQKYEMQVLDSQGDSAKEVDNMRQFAAKAGYNIAKALFDSMGGSGKIFVVEGLLGNTANNSRVEGLEKALAEYPDIEVVAQDTGNWNTDEALTLVETWLTQYPDVGGIWCANDNMVTGAMQALDAAGLLGQVGVCGVDANTDVVAAIAEGNATATVSSNGYLQGGYTLAICYAAWTGLLDVEALPAEYREFATPTVLIDSPEAAKEWQAYEPDFDFSRPFDCRVAD